MPSDLDKLARRMGIRGTGDVFQGPSGLEGIGEVGKCGHWDSEYDRYGYCRDLDCRANRLVEALKAGRARKLPDGTILWLHE